jgi:Zn-dependent M28 family amino/carboxypeptidase
MARFIWFLVAGVLSAQIHGISHTRIRAHTKYLSSDVMEGRGVGSRGERVATEYLATQFALAGALPAGDNGTYFQSVPLVGIEPTGAATLSAVSKGRTLTFAWLDEFVGGSERQQALAQFEAEAIFVGHGIAAPEFQWDDYKGVDVRGKAVVLFTNEPDSTDPKFFGGRALTYYGRWTYKYEEATRRGAAAVILIHTTPTAGYGWNVVRNSWAREQPYVALAPGAPALAFAGWVTAEAAAKLLATSGHTAAELLKAANSRGFRPIPLGLRLRGRVPSKIRRIDTRNVAAMIPGGDPAYQDQAVLFTAHWDHLGVGAAVNGDSIYNGAVDNATGCAILLEMARAWSALEQKPRRAALFVAMTAEEGGLRGSEFHAAHPFFPPGKTAVALNFDGYFPAGITKDVSVGGAERTTLWGVVEDAARRLNYEIKPDPRLEQGSFYRSDHFSMAKTGIPAFSIEQGEEFAGQAAGYGQKLFNEYNERSYHQPSDEFHEEWDFSGLENIARFGFLIGSTVANQEKMPTWLAGDEFLRARENSGVK